MANRSMQDRFEGSLLGLALGDARGAVYEGGLAARLLWRALGIPRPGVLRWTDDTLMAWGLARSLVKNKRLDADHLAQLWAREARWRRGYGPGALRILRRVQRGMPWQEAATSVFPDGSYGNGAAMRVAPIGLLLADPEERRNAAALSAKITHAHPLGVEGAVLMAEATHRATRDALEVGHLLEIASEPAFAERLRRLPELLRSEPVPQEIAKVLGNSIRAHESVVTALYCYLRHRERSFEDLISFVIAMRGDTDTIAAMAGALFGAARGVEALPERDLSRLEDRDALRDAATALHALYAQGGFSATA